MGIANLRDQIFEPTVQLFPKILLPIEVIHGSYIQRTYPFVPQCINQYTIKQDEETILDKLVKCERPLDYDFYHGEFITMKHRLITLKLRYIDGRIQVAYLEKSLLDCQININELNQNMPQDALMYIAQYINTNVSNYQWQKVQKSYSNLDIFLEDNVLTIKSRHMYPCDVKEGSQIIITPCFHQHYEKKVKIQLGDNIEIIVKYETQRLQKIIEYMQQVQNMVGYQYIIFEEQKILKIKQIEFRIDSQIRLFHENNEIQLNMKDQQIIGKIFSGQQFQQIEQRIKWVFVRQILLNIEGFRLHTSIDSLTLKLKENNIHNALVMDSVEADEKQITHVRRPDTNLKIDDLIDLDQIDLIKIAQSLKSFLKPIKIDFYQQLLQ
ncbi:hypothetical protein pb186bvf_019137 [Paramecium bursaria]